MASSGILGGVFVGVAKIGTLIETALKAAVVSSASGEEELPVVMALGGEMGCGMGCVTTEDTAEDDTTEEAATGPVCSGEDPLLVDGFVSTAACGPS